MEFISINVLNGTFDKDYPIVNKKEILLLYYNRNDSDIKNPFTDPMKEQIKWR